MMNKNSGFTLVELLVTLTILSIVTSFAVPTFSEAIRNNQLKSSANNLYSLFQFARAQAAQRGDSVHIGALDNTAWAKGAVVWVNKDADATTFDPANDEELKRSVNDYNLTLTEANSVLHITFNGKGHASATFDMGFCDSRTDETGKRLQVLISGISAVSDKEDC